MIYLVSRDPNTEKESHMVWEGHTTLEDAKKEFIEMRNLSIMSGIKPLDGYVYEANKPEYGNQSDILDAGSFSKYALDWAEKKVANQRG